MRRSPLRRNPESIRAWERRSRERALARLRSKRRRAISPAAPEQRAKCSGRRCVVCGTTRGTHAMHLIDRSLGGDDDPRAVVPACWRCHRLYDEGKISLLEHLEPGYRAELAYAVELVGLLSALRRITNSRWVPESDGEAA